ncbi:hypothetical protein Sinf_1266 [Streptococcus infantarius subsp. infantarius CJ18]|nr:hypothetical protein Sinf_1266 [Streptococcus infantarius subsp. infantarius CJ18]
MLEENFFKHFYNLFCVHLTKLSYRQYVNTLFKNTKKP